MPEGMPPRMLAVRWFARTYGWPEEVTGRLSASAATWLPLIERAEAEVARRKERQEAMSARLGARQRGR